MAIKTLNLGRLVLREDFVAPETVDVEGTRALALSGQESIPRLNAATVRKQREDLLNMERALVPVTFTIKSALDGFYRVLDVSGQIEDWDSNLIVFGWSVNLERIGTPAEVDIESRLSGPQTRSNNFVATGERTHAPALGHKAYWAGSSAPSTVDRPCADGGNLRVYRGIGNGINPRWAISPTGYPAGRCRILDSDSRERAGTRFTLNPAQTWEISNGLTRITPGTGSSTFDLAVWTGSAWEASSWSAEVNNPWELIKDFDYITVLRNEYEAVSVRFTKSYLPSGRLFIDLTLRRGSRVAELYLQNEYGTRLRVYRTTASAGTQTSGYVASNANDPSGNRYMVGSAKTFTANTVNGGVEKTGTATLDVAVGIVLNGNTAISGDLAADLYAQYLGMPSELVQGVRR